MFQPELKLLYRETFSSKNNEYDAADADADADALMPVPMLMLMLLLLMMMMIVLYCIQVFV